MQEAHLSLTAGENCTQGCGEVSFVLWEGVSRNSGGVLEGEMGGRWQQRVSGMEVTRVNRANFLDSQIARIVIYWQVAVQGSAGVQRGHTQVRSGL